MVKNAERTVVIKAIIKPETSITKNDAIMDRSVKSVLNEENLLLFLIKQANKIGK